VTGAGAGHQGRTLRDEPGGGPSKRAAGAAPRDLELTDCGDRKTKTYSGGQKRRLEWASAHAPARPPLLDEPTTGLDPRAGPGCGMRYAGCGQSGTTVFLTTHTWRRPTPLCDRIAIIDHGQDRRRGHARGAQRELPATCGWWVRRPTDKGARRPQGQDFIRELTEEDVISALRRCRQTALPQITGCSTVRA